MTVAITAGITAPHPIESCYGSPLHCHWHNTDEPAAGAYRVCFECGHAYQTSDELVTTWRDQWESSGEPWPIPNAGDIPACPLCAHDW